MRFDINRKATWVKLRFIGNSRLAQLSIGVPVLGYFILFNSAIVEYLKLHSDFCKGTACGVSWRLYFFYFGGCFFALGAGIYGLCCPSVIKVHKSGSDYFESEKTYFSSPGNLKYLFSQIEATKKAPAEDRFQLKTHIVEKYAALNSAHIHALADVMAEYYVLQNNRFSKLRVLCLLAYYAGGFLLLIPTAVTFIQVFIRASSLL